MVWPGEVFWPQEASQSPDFSNIDKNHSWVIIFKFSNFIEIVPIVWISIEDIATNTN
jgi:hypothetical protein